MPEDCGDVGKQEAISQQPHIRVVYGQTRFRLFLAAKSPEKFIPRFDHYPRKNELTRQ